MAFRGRGRGRFGMGFGRGMSIGHAKEEPFVLFPELSMRRATFSDYLPQKLGRLSSDGQAVDIEQYSHKLEIQKRRKETLSSFLNLTADHFPVELIEGAKRVKHDRKKLRWDVEPDLQKLDIFEKLEGKSQDQDQKGKVKSEGDKNEDEEVGSEEEEESSDDGDYNQNVDFDDDEDDLNLDDGDDEPCYDD